MPLCYCFRFSRADIVEEIATTGTSTVGNRIRVLMQAGCRCEELNPSGRCCLGTVLRVERDLLGLQGEGGEEDHGCC